MFCSSCGIQLVDDAVFCQECGVPATDHAAANTVVIPPYPTMGMADGITAAKRADSDVMAGYSATGVGGARSAAASRGARGAAGAAGTAGVIGATGAAGAAGAAGAIGAIGATGTAGARGAAAAARKGARLADMGLGAKILVAAACVIVAAGIVTGAIFALEAWGARSAPNGPTWEELDRAVAENAALRKKLADDDPEVIEDESPPLEPTAPGFAQPPDDSPIPAAIEPEAAYPSFQGGDAQTDIDIRENIVPEAEEAIAPVLPLDPQTQDIPQNPYNTQRVLVRETEYGWVLEFEEWLDGEWSGKLKTTAHVGRNGISSDTREGDYKTPAGTYNLLFCYGIIEPRTNLRFKRIGSGDVFVDDPDSPYYNTIVSDSSIGTGTSRESIYNRFSSGLYTTCIFFDFNGDGETAYTSISGRGSVRTLRGKTKNLQNTLGDIDITGDDMAALLALLDSSKHPIIIIG